MGSLRYAFWGGNEYQALLDYANAGVNAIDLLNLVGHAGGSTSVLKTYTASAAGAGYTNIDTQSGSVHYVTLDANAKFHFTNASASDATSITIWTKQSAPGGYTIDFSDVSGTGIPGLVWIPDGTAPQQITTTGYNQLYTFMTHDGGASWVGWGSVASIPADPGIMMANPMCFGNAGQTSPTALKASFWPIDPQGRTLIVTSGLEIRVRTLFAGSTFGAAIYRVVFDAVTAKKLTATLLGAVQFPGTANGVIQQNFASPITLDFVNNRYYIAAANSDSTTLAIDGANLQSGVPTLGRGVFQYTTLLASTAVASWPASFSSDPGGVVNAVVPTSAAESWVHNYSIITNNTKIFV
jgi:hypothetical protein